MYLLKFIPELNIRIIRVRIRQAHRCIEARKARALKPLVEGRTERAHDWVPVNPFTHNMLLIYLMEIRQKADFSFKRLNFIE